MDVDLEANLNVRGQGDRCVALNAHKHYLHERRGTRKRNIIAGLYSVQFSSFPFILKVTGFYRPLKPSYCNFFFC